MTYIPYLGLNPFSEKDAPFFFGRDKQKREIATSLRVSRLTVLFGESGVGKTSILRAGVKPLLRQDAQQNCQDFGTPQLAVVVFRKWSGENRLQELLKEIRTSVAEAMAIKPTDLEDKPTPVESLKVWTKILGGKRGRGQLFLILDQFEEYFQYHPQESGEVTFAEEFPRWVNRSDLRVNFLIAMRHDALANLYRFQGRILNIFDNQIELKRLNRSAARDAIVKPIGEYNLRQIIADHLQTYPLTVLSAPSGMGKSRVLKAIADNLRVSITFSNWRGNPVTDLVAQVEADLKALFLNISAPEPETSLTETLQSWAERISGEGENTQLFIILDQFEEFFQYQLPEMGEGSFVAEFARAVNDPELPVNFLISIRDEAQDLLKHFEGCIPGIFDHLLRLKQLGENPEIPDLVKPIEEPAQKSSKAIDIEPELVNEVLNQLSALSRHALLMGTSRPSMVIRFVNYISRLVQGKKQAAGSKKDLVNYSANKYTTQKNVEIEAPLLQLVMERLWTEEVINKSSPCLLLKTLNDLSDTEKNITGAQRIANDHVSEQMGALSSDRERNAMAIVFKYLVSGGGTKIAYPILDLPEPTGLDQKDLQSVLEQLDAKRILRTVKVRTVKVPNDSAKVPNDSEEKRYEIFHDILAWPILNWRDRYLLNKKLKQGFLCSLIGGGIIFGGGMYITYENAQMELIQAANTSIGEAKNIFESKSRSSGQIVGLIEAIRKGEELLKLVDNILLIPFSKQIDKKKEISLSNLEYMLKEIREENFLEVTDLPTPVLSVIFSPDGQSLNTFSANGLVSLWNLQKGKPRQFRIREPAISSVSFSDDGNMLAIGSPDGFVRLWNLEGEKPVEKFHESFSQSEILSISFSGNGKMLAIGSADGFVRLLWNLEGDKQIKKILASESDSKRQIWSVSFSGNGQRLASVSADDYVRLWNLEGTKLSDDGFLESKSSISRLTPISFSGDGKMLAIGSADGFVRLWNLEGDKPRPELPLWNSEDQKPRPESREPSPEPSPESAESAISSISFSSDRQKLAVGSNDRSVRLWNLEGQTPSLELKFKSPVPVNSISFSPDGNLLATSSSREGTVRLWNLEPKKPITSNDLKKLVDKGCEQLDNYFKTHPQDLKLMSLNSSDALPQTGTNLIIVAKIGDSYHARIFDMEGKIVVDKQLKPDTTLKPELDTALDNPDIVDQKERELIIRKITLSLDHTSIWSICKKDISNNSKKEG